MKNALTVLAAILAAGAAIAAEPGPDAMFTGMDRNKDHRVTAAEHARGARAMFVAMDANGDGRVTAAEMDAVQATVGNQRADGLTSAEKIKAIDRDHDGMLSLSEHVRGSRAMFARMDRNRNGALSPREFATGHAVLLSRR